MTTRPGHAQKTSEHGGIDPLPHLYLRLRFRLHYSRYLDLILSLHLYLYLNPNLSLHPHLHPVSPTSASGQPRIQREKTRLLERMIISLKRLL